MVEILKRILYEMTQGNFSFAILVVGIIQVYEMIKNNDEKK